MLAWKNAINGIAFNVSWLIIVISQSAVVGLVCAAVHVALHMTFLGKGKVEWLYLIGLVLFGRLLDEVLFAGGVFVIDGNHTSAPVWLSCLWPVMGTTMMHVFAGLQYRLLLATVLGAVGGYGSYSAGMELTSVDFGAGASVFIITLLWALIFPLMAVVARKMQGAEVDVTR